MSIIAFGFLCASIAGADNYVSQSVSWKNNLPESTPYMAEDDEFVLAYNLEQNSSYVVGQFYQKYNNGSLALGISSAPCS